MYIYHEYLRLTTARSFVYYDLSSQKDEKKKIWLVKSCVSYLRQVTHTHTHTRHDPYFQTFPALIITIPRATIEVDDVLISLFQHSRFRSFVIISLSS